MMLDSLSIIQIDKGVGLYSRKKLDNAQERELLANIEYDKKTRLPPKPERTDNFYISPFHCIFLAL